jgi:two-component system cell cycle sensor histidine kinase/response regulator CckA
MTRARILIVEDERIVARDIENRLTRLGYEVVGAARRGEDAVGMAEQLRPNLVLMDIRLEGALDGVAAAQEIRTRWQLPVVYLTAYADQDTLQRARVTEPFGYVLKPFDERELHTAIEMALYKHHAECKLRASERRFAVTLGSIGDAVIATDSQGRITFMNSKAAALTGWPPEEAAGRLLSEVFRIINEQTRQPLEDPAVRVLRDGVTVALANHAALLSRDGRELPIADSGAPIINDKGAVSGAVLVFHDVTEERRAEERLRASEERYRSIFDNAIEGIFQSTPAWQLLTANRSLARILGYSSPEELTASLRDVPCQLLVEPERRAECARLLEERGIVQGFECQVYRKDGSKAWVSLSTRAVRDDQGRVRSYEGTLEEITERKLLEEQFRLAQKLEAVGRLAGGVAHDFNNLLTVINGCTAMLFRELRYSDPSRDLLVEIQKAGERATGLTRQLLVFSRKQTLQPQVVDLNEQIRQLAQVLRWLIGEQVELTLRTDPGLGLVKVDPAQLEQVLMNLAVNARDAMPHGGRLTIETQDVEPSASPAQTPCDVPPGRRARLAVSDTGHGMDEATKARIFEPFFTTKAVGQGTGLGLSLVHGVVRQSGGHIEVSSEVGRGSTFTISLPVVAEVARPDTELPGRFEIPKGTETVLLVDDDDAVRRLSGRILRSHGYTVIEARNGEEALQAARGSALPIDLLLTDVVMPRMGGRQLAAVLAAEQPGLKVLFVSGYTTENVDRADVRERGEDYLPKPFTPLVLASKVREVLDAGRCASPDP